jgi:hypothetical protein
MRLGRLLWRRRGEGLLIVGTVGILIAYLVDQRVRDLAGSAVPAVFQPNGILRLADLSPRPAPLTIFAPNGEGIFAILLYAGTKRTYLSLFINSGSKLETSVPLGVFDLALARGTIWTGTNTLFAPETAFFQIDSLNFHKSARANVGYVLDLRARPNGNLAPRPISAAQFGELAR